MLRQCIYQVTNGAHKDTDFVTLHYDAFVEVLHVLLAYLIFMIMCAISSRSWLTMKHFKTIQPSGSTSMNTLTPLIYLLERFVTYSI